MNQVRRRNFPIAADPFPGTPESPAKFVDSEIEKWGGHVKAAGIEPE